MKVSLGMKLFAGFSVLIIIISGIIMYTLVQVQTLKNLQDSGYTRSAEAIEVTAALDVATALYKVAADAIINGGSVSDDDVMRDWNTTKADSGVHVEKISEYADTDDEKEWSRKVLNDYNELIRLIEKQMLPAIFSMDGEITDEIRNVDAEVDTLISDFQSLIEKFAASLQKESASGDAEFDTVSSSIFVVSVIIGIISTLFGIVIAFLLTRSISKPLMKISGTLTSSSSQIVSASVQLSSSSQEIAGGAAEQAASIEETTSSMEELASMVKQNAGNAHEANLLADKASDASQTGYTQMEKMLTSISEISKSSNEIRKIINVIDSIAFQTNILALNAAVEAARAGEAGMGFAVVADEVKNLANKSATAAKETSAIIEDSIKRTESGLDIASKLAETFKDILSHARKVAEMAKEVETASRQQDSGINQVNKAIVQFDEVVQNNANAAQEAASSAEELNAQAETLNGVVNSLVKLVTGKINSIAEEHYSLKNGYGVALASHKTSNGKTPVKKHTVISTGQVKKKDIAPDKFVRLEEDTEFRDIT